MRFFAFVTMSFLMIAPFAQADGAKPTVAHSAAKNAAEVAAVSKLTFTNKLVEGKKTWLPSDAKVPAGKIELTLVNTLGEPHGFTAPGLTPDIVVAGNETKLVKIDAAKAGAYKFHCQLHPAHVGGSITVQ